MEFQISRGCDREGARAWTFPTGSASTVVSTTGLAASVLGISNFLQLFTCKAARSM